MSFTKGRKESSFRNVKICMDNKEGRKEKINNKNNRVRRI
jgi:hypothetical protein